MTQDTDPMRDFFTRLGHMAHYDPERGMPTPLVVHSEDAHWIGEDITHNPGRIGCLPAIPARTMEIFLQEIPQGGTSDLQRHTHETVHYLIEGEGHSEIGPQVVRWRTGSFVYTPVWVWHRHYNDGPQMVRMLTIESSRLLEAMSLARRESAGLVSYADYMARPDASKT
jgi:gentisate 1,2-dioxygenase